MNPVFRRHLDRLKDRWPNTTAETLPSGAMLVTVPDVAVPAGWSVDRTTIRFISPVGYPTARPDCFWADRGFRLTSGAMPANTAENQIPETATTAHWFSWHMLEGQWNANRDDLVTYFGVIQDRFREVR